ncbi:MAG: hypothetical protein CL677_06285 [Bdellovibrionaceae bacterium]|nr:hypothetical protein [Pseudobdellovibrionaceae bacterium]|tara:strand:+ start:26610 stop:29279 length:2670 start_codon:yes stop_codon:yes gene_type:complete
MSSFVGTVTICLFVLSSVIYQPSFAEGQNQNGSTVETEAETSDNSGGWTWRSLFVWLGSDDQKNDEAEEPEQSESSKGDQDNSTAIATTTEEATPSAENPTGSSDAMEDEWVYNSPYLPTRLDDLFEQLSEGTVIPYEIPNINVSDIDDERNSPPSFTIFNQEFSADQEEPGPEYADELLNFMSQRRPLTGDSRKINRYSSYSTTFSFPEKMHLSLAPETRVIGPHKQKDSLRNQIDYYPTIFRYILFAADEAARGFTDDPESNPYLRTDPNMNFTYYTWLVAALATPHHESRLHHFIKGSGEVCNPDLNGLKVYDPGGRYQKVMNQAYKDPYNVLAPDCEFIKNEPILNKILTSGDYSDFGFMQLNIYHQRKFIDPNYAFHLKRTIMAGIKYLWDSNGSGGYVGFRENFKDYNCAAYNPTFDFYSDPFYEDIVSESTGETKRRYQPNTLSQVYFNLIRAGWAAYNQGNILEKSVCRIANSNAWDTPFLHTLNSIVKYNTSVYHKGLHPDTDEYKAFLEIVYNFRRIFLTKKLRDSMPEKDYYINKVLAKERNHSVMLDDPVTHLGFEANYLLTTNSTTLHNSPSKLDSNGATTQCGILERPKKMSLVKLQVMESTINENTGVPYAKIKLPKYDLMARKIDPSYITLKEGKSAINVRTSPETIGTTCRPEYLAQYPNAKHNCAGRWDSEESTAKEHASESREDPTVEAIEYPNEIPFFKFKGSYPVVDYTKDKKWIKFRIGNSGRSDKDFAWIYRPLVDEKIDEDGSSRAHLCNTDTFYIDARNIAKMYEKPLLARLKSGVNRSNIYLLHSTRSRVIDTLYSIDWRPNEQKYVIVLSEISDNEGILWYKVQNMNGDIGFMKYDDLETSPADVSSETFDLDTVIGDSFEG